MATNKYFNHYHAANEQNLIESMIIESIEVQGLDVAYIPRTQENISVLYNEDPQNVFNTFRVIEMYPASVEGFDGDQLMTVFGNEFKKSATFVVAKRRFEETFPDLKIPRAGDLIFMPITNTVFEIRFLNVESPFFEKGKQYVYELKVEAFEYSYEGFDIAHEGVDEILANMVIKDPDENTEPFGKNDDIAEDSDESIVYDPANPFGIRN